MNPPPDEFEARLYRDHDAERALLCEMMISKHAAFGALEWGITEADFSEPRHRLLFSIFHSLHNAGKEIDYAVISDEAFKINSDLEPCYIAEILSVVMTGAAWQQHCQILREKRGRRRFRDINFKMSELFRDPGITADDLVIYLREQSQEAAEALQDIRDGDPSKDLDDLADILERQVPPERFGFGLPCLDSALCAGIERGELLVVGGETSSGKSVLLQMAALEALRSDKKVALISLEMSGPSVLQRIGSNYCGIRMKPLSEYPNSDEKDRASEAMIFLRSKIKFLGLPNISNISEIETFCRIFQPDVMIVDYLQLVQSSEGDNREQQISTICRRIKNLGVVLNCAAFTASQLNDDGRLRESRAIGQHADHVLIIGQESRTILVVKNRRGAAGEKLPVTFRGEISRFE